VTAAGRESPFERICARTAICIAEAQAVATKVSRGSEADAERWLLNVGGTAFNFGKDVPRLETYIAATERMAELARTLPVDVVI
jgi:hypothetical protein